MRLEEVDRFFSCLFSEFREVPSLPNAVGYYLPCVDEQSVSPIDGDDPFLLLERLDNFLRHELRFQQHGIFMLQQSGVNKAWADLCE